MTEQSPMPLVGPPKRRGWAEIFWFRPLTASTHATLVVTRRGRLASILPAGGPRVLSDYLAWPYDFREVDTRERLLTLEQRVESFDSSYEFLVSLRLIYQVMQPDRVALELDDVLTELTLAVVQSLRLSGRSFGVEQDKTFEEHLQETLINSDSLAQRAQLLGLALRRADVIVALDEPTRAHAEALRFAMRERPLHFQIAVESLEPDRSFDVHVGGAYRLTERRAQDEPSDMIDSAIQTAITRTLQRIGITFEPGDYLNAAKAMAEVLRKDVLLQSELAMVHAQLLRPTVQIQPDRSMVHIPRPNMLGASDLRPDPMLRRSRQGLPRMGRPPALVDTQEPTLQPTLGPAVRRALPPPEAPLDDIAARQAAPPDSLLSDNAASPTLPLEDLPAQGDPIEGAYALWPQPEVMPTMRPRSMPNQADDESDTRAPWADLIRAAEEHADDIPWQAAPAASLSEPAALLPWETLAVEEADQSEPWEQTPTWLANPPASFSAPVEPLPWEPVPVDSAVDQPAVGAAVAPERDQHESDALFGSQINGDADQLAVEAAVASEEDRSGSVEQAAFEAAVAPEEDRSESDALFGSQINGDADQLAAEAAVASEENERGSDTVFEFAHRPDAMFEPEIAPPEPAFLDADPVENLGFSLDWSEPEVAQVGDQAASISLPTGDAIADDLGFSLDWSDPQVDSSAHLPASSDGTTADTSIFMAHWDDHDLAVPEPADNLPAAATMNLEPWPTVDLDTLLADPQQAQPESSPAELEQDVQQDEASLIGGQEAPPWYAPTLHFNDQLPFDSYAEAPQEAFGAAWADAPALSEPSEDVHVADDIVVEAPQEAFGAAWADAPAPSEPVEQVAADIVVEAPQEAFGAAWADAPAPSEPSEDVAAEATIEAPADLAPEEFGVAWAGVPAPSEPALPADAAIQSLDEIVSAEPLFETTSAQAPADASDQIAESTESAANIPADLIARMLGMIQSYGPAWFKMWSLELKERPERLPVVLGEVTADPVLLAQADDPRVQAALLAALAAYTSPSVHLARLSASASLPSPVMANQSDTNTDEVPDWLSLRVKWNGHGGGA